VGSRIGDVLWGRLSYLDPALKKKINKTICYVVRMLA
jgi:hypothetical protein